MGGTSRIGLPFVSVGLSVAGGVFGTVGSAVAVASTANNLGLSDQAELALITAPALLAGLMAFAGGLSALGALVRKDAANRLIAWLGLLASVCVALAAIGWVAFMGGLALLSMLAWH